MDEFRLVPEAEFKGSLGFRRSIVNLALKENLTVRELSLRYGGGHQEVVGIPAVVGPDRDPDADAGADAVVVDLTLGRDRQVQPLSGLGLVGDDSLGAVDSRLDPVDAEFDRA